MAIPPPSPFHNQSFTPKLNMFLNSKNTRLKYSVVGIGTEEVYENENLFF